MISWTEPSSTAHLSVSADTFNAIPNVTDETFFATLAYRKKASAAEGTGDVIIIELKRFIRTEAASSAVPAQTGITGKS
ncbi:MAG: hypothetical protein GY792_08780 [Gammaproteobacteria bacterium]|nr:hypothetical protein [Gammaproteobacteria bacterium]